MSTVREIIQIRKAGLNLNAEAIWAQLDKEIGEVLEGVIQFPEIQKLAFRYFVERKEKRGIEPKFVNQVIERMSASSSGQFLSTVFSVEGPIFGFTANDTKKKYRDIVDLLTNIVIKDDCKQVIWQYLSATGEVHLNFFHEEAPRLIKVSVIRKGVWQDWLKCRTKSESMSSKNSSPYHYYLNKQKLESLVQAAPDFQPIQDFWQKEVLDKEKEEKRVKQETLELRRTTKVKEIFVAMPFVRRVKLDGKIFSNPDVQPVTTYIPKGEFTLPINSSDWVEIAGIKITVPRPPQHIYPDTQSISYH